MDGDFKLEQLTASAQTLLEETLLGLGQPQKTLSPKWLYDRRGSELFEQITELPEYYLTRTETAILRENAEHLCGIVPNGGVLAELGSGASAKTRLLLDQGHHFGAYAPIDISEDFLLDTAATLKARYPTLAITPIVADFLSPVTFPAQIAELPKVGFFPGSTIGNLPPELGTELLKRAANWPGVTHFILGADLVKDRSELVAAYDDAQGVTAEFITNILRRLNRELNANFNLDQFRYQADWNESLQRIDMRVVSQIAQSVDLCGQSISFAAKEAIHVSASRKYTEDTLNALVESAGWSLDDLLTDPDEKCALAILKTKTG